MTVRARPERFSEPPEPRHSPRALGRSIEAVEREDDPVRLRLRLHELDRALSERAEVARGPDGLYAELSREQPAIGSRLGRLARDHADLLGSVRALRTELEAGAPADAVAGAKAALVQRVRAHCAAEWAAAQETWLRDLGCGD